MKHCWGIGTREQLNKVMICGRRLSLKSMAWIEEHEKLWNPLSCWDSVFGEAFVAATASRFLWFHTKVKVGTGNMTLFWKDTWLLHRPLNQVNKQFFEVAPFLTD